MRVAKTKALISFAVTAKLICVFVFAYADCWFSHDAVHFHIELVIQSRQLLVRGSSNNDVRMSQLTIQDLRLISY